MSKKNDKKEKIEEFFKICKKDSNFFEMDDFLVWKTIMKNVCTGIKKKTMLIGYVLMIRANVGCATVFANFNLRLQAIGCLI